MSGERNRNREIDERKESSKKVCSRETVSSGVKERLEMTFLKRTVSKRNSSQLKTVRVK